MKRLSVIIPVYNVAPYLEECLQSVVAQDMKDMEIICVEDKSTDDSLTILKDFAVTYDNIHIIEHAENKGLSAARNTGIKAAQGEYIQFVDSDDIIKAGTSVTLYDYAKKYDADVVYFNMEFLNDEKNRLIRNPEKEQEFLGVYTGLELFVKHQEADIYKPEAVRHFMKRKFIIDNALFFYEGIIHEDNLFAFMVVMKAERAVDLNQQLYIYRQRKNSISWGQKEKSASSLLVCLINICSYWICNEFSEKENIAIGKRIKALYSKYQHHRGYQNKELVLGDERAQMLQRILFDKYFKEIVFDAVDIQMLKKAKGVIVYGAGKMAYEVLGALSELKIEVTYIAVTSKENNPKLLFEIPVKEITELSDCKDFYVVLGTDKQRYSEIEKILKEKGFNKYIYPCF